MKCSTVDRQVIHIIQRMPLPKNFDVTLVEQTDQQLYDMLAHADDYLPEALTAARAQIHFGIICHRATEITEMG